jgi:hypothetical protein
VEEEYVWKSKLTGAPQRESVTLRSEHSETEWYLVRVLRWAVSFADSVKRIYCAPCVTAHGVCACEQRSHSTYETAGCTPSAFQIWQVPPPPWAVWTRGSTSGRHAATTSSSCLPPVLPLGSPVSPAAPPLVWCLRTFGRLPYAMMPTGFQLGGDARRHQAVPTA